MKSFFNVGNTLPGFFSQIGPFLVTNIPKFFCSIMRTGSSSQIKLMTMLLGLVKVVLSSSCNGQLKSEAKNNYFSTPGGDGSLWIKFNLETDLKFIGNRSCGIYDSFQQNVMYNLRGCACEIVSGYSPDGGGVAKLYNLFEIYGFNVTDQLINCVKEYLETTFCPPRAVDYTPVGVLLFIVGSGALFFILKHYLSAEPEGVVIEQRREHADRILAAGYAMAVYDHQVEGQIDEYGGVEMGADGGQGEVEDEREIEGEGEEGKPRSPLESPRSLSTREGQSPLSSSPLRLRSPRSQSQSPSPSPSTLGSPIFNG